MRGININSFKDLDNLINDAKTNNSLRSFVIKKIATGIIGDTLASEYINYCSKVWNCNPCFLHWGLAYFRQEHLNKFENVKNISNKINKNAKKYKSHLVSIARKQDVTIKNILDIYGVRVKGNMACCPFHADSTPSFSFNDMLWKCHGCGLSGNILTLIDFLEDRNKNG